ncbi:LP14331p [Strongyloides ratti]|uniref:ABC-type xenobiotic transporter n=1 Tax=Strongyloides ratti TaxID=34506 RepID=A0A090LI25_STRRB|nr:LP14331p [Strongyloides ratti]CEF67783.1 LP14331p [Strongyloides ratti]
MKKNNEELIPLINKSSINSSINDNSHHNFSSQYGGVLLKKNANYWIFSFLKRYDYFCIVIGTIAAVIQGAGLPLLSIIFGNMTTIFIDVQNSEWLTGVTITNSTSKGISKKEFEESIYKCCIYYLGIGLLMLTTGFVQVSCWEGVAERTIHRIRKKYFSSIIRQQIEWFDTGDMKTGNLSNKLSDDMERLREGLGDKISFWIQNVAGCISGICIGLYFDWRMTIALLIFTPLIVATGSFMAKIIASRSILEQTIYGECAEIAQETLVAIKTVHAMNGEKRQLKRYNNALNKARKAGLKKYFYLGLGVSASQIMIFSSYALSILYIGYALTKKINKNEGNIITVMMSVMSGSTALGVGLPYLNNISMSYGASKSILKILNSVPSNDTSEIEGLNLSKVSGSIEFKNVKFRYSSRPDVQVIKDLSINIKSGEKVAFVGTSGSGKSTILSLLLRFYDPESGDIYIDGHNIKQLNINNLREHIGVVSQEPVLFDGTIEDNIKIGHINDENISRKQIISACKNANILSFIETLPNGLKTKLGGRGLQISGGQKQRIAIARAIIRNPKILLLDEATSALDTESEKIVQEALDKLQENRTTIAVSHRLSTIKSFDKIYVFQNGAIVEEGTYNYLYQLKGIFYKMIKEQEINKKEDSVLQNNDDERKSSVLKYKSSISNDVFNTIESSKKSSLFSIIEYEDEIDRDTIKPSGIKKIFIYNKKYWKFFVFGLIGSCISGLVTPLFSLIYAQMFTIFTESGDNLQKQSYILSVMFILVGLIFAFGFMISSLSLGRAGENLTKKLRYDTFENLLRQDMSFYDNKRHNTGKICTRLATDVPNVRFVFTRLPAVISCIVTLFGAIGIGLYFGYQLTLILLLMIPLMIGAGYFQMKMQMNNHARSNIKLEEAGLLFDETIDNIRTVHSFNLQNYFYKKFCEKLNEPHKDKIRQTKVYGFVFAFSQSILPFFYAASFYFGSIFIKNLTMEPLNVLRVFFTMSFSGNSTGQLASFIPDIIKAKLAASLIFHLIEYPTKIDSLSQTGHQLKIKGKIKINNIHFSYPTRKSIKVLDGLSLECKEEQSIALVGHSGCGKSTIMQLLERFYLFRRGTIKIDGYNIEDINIQCLRNQISIVSQEPTLFNCSIEENILYGLEEENIPHEKVVEAAKIANIHNFISNLPEGYSTIVNNASLSGGQRQRISIARSIVRNPKILLLDEATSALDSESEIAVQKALDNAKVGRTTLSICHRLSSVQNCDLIFVINEGKVSEIGNHQQLLEKKGLYKKLCDNQQLTE